MSVLLQLALTFSMLSVLAVGGGTAVLPEMQNVLSMRFGLDRLEFVHIYSMGQLSPGPNMLVVVIFGYKIEGFLGAAVVLFSFLLPSSVLCLSVGRLWHRIGERPWRRAVQNAMEPIAIGLMCSGVYAVAQGAINGLLSVTLALTTLSLIMLTRINTMVLILGMGVLGGALMVVFGWR